MWIKLISIWKASHLDSLWNRGERQLGNRLELGCLTNSVAVRCGLLKPDDVMWIKSLSCSIFYSQWYFDFFNSTLWCPCEVSPAEKHVSLISRWSRLINELSQWVPHRKRVQRLTTQPENRGQHLLFPHRCSPRGKLSCWQATNCMHIENMKLNELQIPV